MYFSYYNILQEGNFAEHVRMPQITARQIFLNRTFDFKPHTLKGIIFYDLYE